MGRALTGRAVSQGQGETHLSPHVGKRNRGCKSWGAHGVGQVECSPMLGAIPPKLGPEATPPPRLCWELARQTAVLRSMQSQIGMGGVGGGEGANFGDIKTQGRQHLPDVIEGTSPISLQYLPHSAENPTVGEIDPFGLRIGLYGYDF